MKHIMILAAFAAFGLAVLAGEHDTPQTSGDFARLVAGEKVYAGNIAVVASDGLAYAVTSTNGTAIGVFQYSAAAGEKVLAKRGGFVMDNAGDVTPAQIGATAYSVTSNAWTVTKTSGTTAVGKIADVRDGKVIVVVGR